MPVSLTSFFGVGFGAALWVKELVAVELPICELLVPPHAGDGEHGHHDDDPEPPLLPDRFLGFLLVCAGLSLWLLGWLRSLNLIAVGHFFLLSLYGHTVVQQFFVIFYDLYGHVERLRDEIAVSLVHLFGYRVFGRVDESERGFASGSSLSF